MKIRAFIILTSCFFSWDLGWAESFRALGIPLAEEYTEKCVYEQGQGRDYEGLSRIFNMEKVVFTDMRKRAETVSLEGKDYYRIAEKQRLVNGQILENTYLVAIGEYLKPLSYDFVRKNPEGRILRSGTINYDDESWDYPDDLYPIPLLSVVFRSLIVHNLEENSFHLWLDDLAIVPMKVTVLGREGIRVIGEERNCHKMVMELDIHRLPFGGFGRFIIRLFKPWMPQFYFWFWENEPYPLLHFANPGRENAPQSRSEVVEYTSHFPPIRWIKTEEAERERPYDGGE